MQKDPFEDTRNVVHWKRRDLLLEIYFFVFHKTSGFFRKRLLTKEILHHVMKVGLHLKYGKTL